jgi:hypothetical protein
MIADEAEEAWHRRLLSAEREDGVALLQKRHEPRQASHRRMIQKVLLGDSPESQARPSEEGLAPAGEEPFRRDAGVEDAGSLLPLDEARDTVGGGEDRRAIPGIEVAPRASARRRLPG